MSDTHATTVTDSRAGTLLLFSESFPYEAALEDTFLGPELPHLQRAFKQVIVIPSRRGGGRCEIPDDVTVEEGLWARQEGHAGRVERVARALRSRLFWADLLAYPTLLWHPRGLARLASACARASLTREWFSDFLAARGLEPRDCVAYTFWCDFTTTGLGLAKRSMPELVVVSRAHGADLYPERHDPPFLPGRPFTLRRLDHLFPDSDRGRQYVADRFPWFASRCSTARMGVSDPGFRTTGSQAGRLSVVSCSRMVPVKRIDRILGAVAEAARSRPDVQIAWRHIGDGPLRRELEQAAADIRAANLTIDFARYTSNEDLFEFYRTQPVDVFVNASESEGTPVSLIEAISCGIPVIATAVGGNPEVVSERNGRLVGPDASPGQIAAALLALYDHPDEVRAIRLSSRELWERAYDAEVNLRAFASALAELRTSR